MKLIYTEGNRAEFEAGTEVQVGDEATTFRGEIVTVQGISQPTSPGSTGRVAVGAADQRWTMEYFPSVIGAEWVDRTDR